MAMQLRYRCKECGFTAEGWDEGNPYIEFSNGKREYFYHPGGELELMRRLMLEGSDESLGEERSRGNAPDHLCLDCKEVTMLDPDRDKMQCPKCKGTNLAEPYNLKGHPCPDCGEILGEGAPVAIS